MKKCFYYVSAFVGADDVYISLRVLQVQMGYFTVLRVAKWANICYVREERMSFIMIVCRYRSHLNVVILTENETTLHNFYLYMLLIFIHSKSVI
jgi:hypothetical protein